MDKKKTQTTAHAVDAQARAGRAPGLPGAQVAVARGHSDELNQPGYAGPRAQAGGNGGSVQPDAEVSDGLWAGVEPDAEADTGAGARANAEVAAEIMAHDLTTMLDEYGLEPRSDDGELAVTGGRFDPAAAGMPRVDSRSGTATLVVAVADEDGDATRPGQRSYPGLYPDPTVISPDAGGS